MNYKKSIIGSIIAFVIATSCCWLPALIIMLGGASSMLASKVLRNDVNKKEVKNDLLSIMAPSPGLEPGTY